MTYVTVSPKYQMVIPKEVREHMNIKPGEKLSVVERDGIIHLVPIRDVKSMKGFLKETATEDLREEGERFS